MSFDGESCLLFLMKIKPGDVRPATLDRKLARHALVCDCDCSVCEELRVRHNQTKENIDG